MFTIQEFFRIGMDRQIPELLSMPEGLILNIGAGNKKIKNTIEIDYPEFDLDIEKLPYKDCEISGIHCYHFLEHMKDPVLNLIDFQRVLYSGGVLNIVVPYYNSQMAYHDLDHKKFFCEDTWKILFNNPYYDKNKIEWKFEIHANFIIGIVERNLSLFTQLIKK